MAKTLHNVQRLRLNSVANLRKTRSRLLRLFVAEEESTLDLAYWKTVFSQLDSLRSDFSLEREVETEGRLRKIEEALRARGYTA